MPQMKPTFWLDVLTSNSLCLMSTMSVLYFFLTSPLITPALNKPLPSSTNSQNLLNQWFWKW